MKKKTESDKERLTQLKQNFNNPSKFWEIIRSINRKSTIYDSITSEQWYEHFSGVFNTFDSLPEEEDSDDVMVCSMNLSLEMRSQPVYVT